MTASGQTNTNTKLYGLDHLRALAIIMVFVFHIGHLFPSPAWVTSIGKFGWTGVDLFFVLSGYLIAAQLFQRIAMGKPVGVKEFFLKRFFRIIPVYLFVVALYFCFPFMHEREALSPLWKYLTFTQNLGLNIAAQGTFSHAWSLCIEEQFYVCLPLILVCLIYFKALKRGLFVIAGLVLLGFAARYCAYERFVLPYIDGEPGILRWYRWIYYPTYARLDGLLVGVSIAAFSCFRPLWMTRVSKYGNLFLLASICIFLASSALPKDERSLFSSVFAFTIIDIGLGLMVFSAICAGSILYKYELKITARIATLSYALYLIHKISIHVTQAAFSKLNIAVDGNVMFLICIVTSVMAAWILNRIIERPFMRLRDRVLQVRSFTQIWLDK